MYILFLFTDTFHEVRRRRDRKKEVNFFPHCKILYLLHLLLAMCLYLSWCVTAAYES